MPETNWTNVEILIVEDSRTQAMLLQASLEEKCPQVTWANNGVEALEMIQKKPPTIIISDIEMPKMNGYELCQHIKSHTILKEIPIILLTALSDPFDVINGIKYGADYFLTKPYKTDLLFSYIEDALFNRQVLSHSAQKDHLEFTFKGQHYNLPSNPLQITNLLLSTYSSATQKNQELEQVNKELNLAHQELRKKNEDLSKLNDQKNQFLGMAAHDLRNPLGIIIGYVNLLLNSLPGKVDEKTILKLNHILKSSTMMLNLINNLLDISVIESGKVKLDMKRQNLVATIQDNIALNQSFAEKKQIKLTFQLSDAIPDITFDSQKIDQVLNNLIENAIKFSNLHTTIIIALSKTPTEVILAIKDQGVGIPAHEQGRLFQTFVKTSAKSTAGESSTGLGLAIAKKIITEHKGRIWLESELEKGSTFFVALPLT